jgi:hypothetical protein
MTTTTIDVWSDVLPHVRHCPTTHAVLTLLSQFLPDQNLHPCLRQEDGSYLPAAQVLTTIKVVNELLNGHPIAQQVARDLNSICELSCFRDPVVVNDDDETTLVVDPRSDPEEKVTGSLVTVAG